jgi:Holliday junction resolvase RusA-like endonuclease
MNSFKVQGKIHGKGRARSFRHGNFIRHVTPEKTVNYENLIGLCFLEQCDEKHFNQEPLEMEIRCFFEVPKSFSKKKRDQALNGEILPTKKPDADNIAKIYCDALNKIAYTDDTQIIKLTITKTYSETEYTETVIQKHVKK